MAGWDGVLPLQMAHRLRVLAMSLVMPGQNSEASARAVMPLIPWWAACSASRHAGRSSDGMIILSPRQMTPSIVERWCMSGKYSRMDGGMWCLAPGGPFSMTVVSCRKSSSAAVATWSDSQSSGMPEVAAHMAEARPASSSSVGVAMEMPARSVVGILGLWCGHAASGVVLSSDRLRRSGCLTPDGWRERASLVWFLTPGMWTILNRYLRVFSLRFRSLVFGISSRDLSPKSFSRGL